MLPKTIDDRVETWKSVTHILSPAFTAELKWHKRERHEMTAGACLKEIALLTGSFNPLLRGQAIYLLLL